MHAGAEYVLGRLLAFLDAPSEAVSCEAICGLRGTLCCCVCCVYTVIVGRCVDVYVSNGCVSDGWTDMVRRYQQCVEDIIPSLNKSVSLAKDTESKVR